MVCTGFRKAPGRQFRRAEIKHMPSGRLKKVSGIGQCPDCNGLYVTRLGIGDTPQMVWHHDLRQAAESTKKTQANRWRYWHRWQRLAQIPGLEDHYVPYEVGVVDQRVNIIEQIPGRMYVATNLATATYATSTAWISPQTPTYTQTIGDTLFRLEVDSRSYHPASNTWLYSFNGGTYWFQDSTVTVMTDMATWDQWNNNLTISSRSRVETGQVWANWAGTTTITTATQIAHQLTGHNLYQPAYTAPRPDPAEVERQRQRRAEELFERTERDRIARVEAVAKAEGTLLSLLTPEQRQQYRDRKHFHVRGSRGNLYRILHGSSGNVRQVLSEADTGRGLHAYCAHPQMTVVDEEGQRGVLPHEDAMIAQMLHLQLDEDAFLAVANRHW